MVIPSKTTGEECNSILCDVDNDDFGLEDSIQGSRHCPGLEDPRQGLGVEELVELVEELGVEELGYGIRCWWAPRGYRGRERQDQCAGVSINEDRATLNNKWIISHR